jgi:hypothetical protein
MMVTLTRILWKKNKKGFKKRRLEHSAKGPHTPKNAARGACHACGKPGHYWSAGKCKQGLEWIRAKEHVPAVAAKTNKAKEVSKKGKLAQAAATKAKGQKQTDKEAKALKAAAAAKKAAGAHKKAAAAAESSDDEGAN